MRPKRNILPDVNAMLRQLPVDQRLEAAVSLIGFGVSEFGKLVLQALEQRKPKRVPLVKPAKRRPRTRR